MNAYSCGYTLAGMNTIGDRVRIARKDNGMTQGQLAAAVGIAQPTLSNLEKGKHAETVKIVEIAKILGVRPEWLSSGVGPMRADDAVPAFDQNVVPAPIGTRQVPIIDYVQAGAWTAVADPFPPGAAYEYVLTDLDLSGAAFGLRVKGRSMAPEFSEGDVIIIDPEVSPAPGDFVVAKNGGQEATFKKYRPRGIDPATGTEIFELIPLNEDFAPIRSDVSPCIIIGTMMEHRRYRRR